jgi:para-aminobenzoate synthetase component 1
MFAFPVAYMNSNDGTSILAFGSGPEITLTESGAFDKMQAFVDTHKSQFIFGCLSYDLKNQVEKSSSENLNRHEFPDAIFWVPRYVVRFQNETYLFEQGESCEESESFIRTFVEESTNKKFESLPYELIPRTDREAYLKNVIQLKDEIQHGNIYEVNYCQEFYAENVEIDNPLNTYFKLNSLTKAPYSSFFSINEFSIFSGSPECFLRKEGNKLISSPIKGTHKRGASAEEDKRFKHDLLNDQKERSENVMIVDLVRNDLSKIAAKGSVNVDELFGIYTFETVHQMISTISCEVRENVSFSDILKATFPMGSMTGAPKMSAMQLIEKHEDFQRGIYSGSVGFIAPNGDFDFNVIIRTLIYNAKKKYLSCPVGGAITINSSPEKEYEECLIKVKGILDQMYAEA